LDSDYGPHFLEVADPSKHKILPSLLVFHVLRCPLWPLAFVISCPVMHCAAFPLPRSPCLRKWLTAGARDGSPSHAVSADLPMGSVDFGERASARARQVHVIM
jgi:hypothetical protein